MLEDAKKESPLEAKEVKAKAKKKLVKEAIADKLETLPRHVAAHPGGHPSRK
jgi:DNA polymerase III alpha subunit